MNSPALYKVANKLQRCHAEELIDEFIDSIRLRTDGRDSLLDVGCGTGDVLMDFIQPILPETYTKIVGIDISPEMIQHSNKTYAEDKVNFKVLDIETERMPLEYYEQFDHVTSFYCLHWIRNQRQALMNIYNTLLISGDCLLVFIASSPVFDAYEALAVNPKWTKYMNDVQKFLPVSQKHADPYTLYANLFKDIGFSDFQVDICKKEFTFDEDDSFKEFLMAVNPFVDRIPGNKRAEYGNDLCEFFRNGNYFKHGDQMNGFRYKIQNKLVVGYAKK